MRLIKFGLALIGGLLLIALILLVFLGGLRGEARHVVQIDIARPAADVYPWLVEPDKIKTWLGWMIDARNLTTQPGVARARQLWVLEDRNNNNQRMEIEVEITDARPGELLAARLTHPEVYTGTLRYELEPMDAKRTRLMFRANFSYKQFTARLFEPIISRGAQQKLEEDVARLKQVVEAQ